MIWLLRFIAHNSAVSTVLVISPLVKFELCPIQVPKSSTLCWTWCFTSSKGGYRFPSICYKEIVALLCSRCYLFCFRGKGKFPFLEKDMQRGACGWALLPLPAHRGKIFFTRSIWTMLADNAREMNHFLLKGNTLKIGILVSVPCGVVALSLHGLPYSLKMIGSSKNVINLLV